MILLLGEDASILQLLFAVLELSFKKFQMRTNTFVHHHLNAHHLTIEMAPTLLFIGI